MEQDKNKEVEKENLNDKPKSWIDKAEEFIDETSEKIHKSDTYKKADKSVEEATKKIFRQAGKWWGKSEEYLNKQRKDRKKE